MNLFARCAAVLALATMVTTGCTVAPEEQGEEYEEQALEGTRYLALGDSLAFGWSPLVPPTQTSGYVGYPEVLAGYIKRPVANAACPGETSYHMISLTGHDNGCAQNKAAYPLKVAYTGTQLDFAVSYLTRFPKTSLVTIDIGGNDLQLIQRWCGTDALCQVAKLPGVLNDYRNNLKTIYSRIRSVYKGEIVAVTAYAFNYNDFLATTALSQANNILKEETEAVNGRVADAYEAFKKEAERIGGGDICKAGLSIALATGGCDPHPSVKGRTLIAQTMLKMLPEYTCAGGAITAYEHANFAGRRVTICAGSIASLSDRRDNLFFWESWNDRISSFRIVNVPSTRRVDYFRNANFDTRVYTTYGEANVASLGTLNDTFSSIRFVIY